MKTKIINEKDIPRSWKLVDANEKVLGRLATRVATLLIGKNKPGFSPHQDWGDYVIIINAEKVRVTGRKADQKTYFRHTFYPGGAKVTPFRRLQKEKPAEIVRHAVRGMIKATGPLGRRIYKKLFVYAGTAHPHIAQQPEIVTL